MRCSKKIGGVTGTQVYFALMNLIEHYQQQHCIEEVRRNTRLNEVRNLNMTNEL